MNGDLSRGRLQGRMKWCTGGIGIFWDFHGQEARAWLVLASSVRFSVFWRG